MTNQQTTLYKIPLLEGLAIHPSDLEQQQQLPTLQETQQPVMPTRQTPDTESIYVRCTPGALTALQEILQEHREDVAVEKLQGAVILLPPLGSPGTKQFLVSEDAGTIEIVSSDKNELVWAPQGFYTLTFTPKQEN